MEERRGEEIVAAGRFFPAGTRVVTWLDAGGYNLYQRPPSAPENHEPRRALAGVTSRRGEWKRLQAAVDQLVLHYDNTGSSAATFGVLQRRGLSAHFLVDVDGTIYQTLDLRERGWHATIANERSIGIEIAQIGAFPPAEAATLTRWYEPDPAGGVRLKATRPGSYRPQRSELIRGQIQSRELIQYDFTPEQYTALAHLAAALNRVFPRIRLETPRAKPTGRFLRANWRTRPTPPSPASSATTISRRTRSTPAQPSSGRNSSKKRAGSVPDRNADLR